MSDFSTSMAHAGAILPPEFSELVQKPLAAASVAFNPAVTTVMTAGSNELRIPILDSDPTAAWTAEGAEISTSAPALDEVNVQFAKVAGLTSVTREMALDSNPAAMQIAGDGLARDIARKIDAALFGKLNAPAPRGLGWVTPSTVTGELTSLDVFADAIAAVAEHGSTVTGFVVNPADAVKIRKLKTGEGYLSPLLGQDATQATGSTIFGVPVVESTDVAAGTGWAMDARDLIVAQRQGVELAISDQPFFTSDRYAVRAVARVGFAIPVPEKLVKMNFAAA